MVDAHIAIVLAYYQGMADKNIHEMEKYLHADVRLISSFTTISGKENVLKAAEKFFALLEGMHLRAQCGAEQQVMVVYDVLCEQPVGVLRTAILLSLRDGLICSIELFHDTRMFEMKAGSSIA